MALAKRTRPDVYQKCPLWGGTKAEPSPALAFPWLASPSH